MLFLVMMLVGFVKTIYSCELPAHLKTKKEASITLNGKQIFTIGVMLLKQSQFLCDQQPKQVILADPQKTPFVLDMDLSVYEIFINLDIKDLRTILQFFEHDFATLGNMFSNVSGSIGGIKEKIEANPTDFWKIIKMLKCKNMPKEDALAQLTLNALAKKQNRTSKEEKIYKKLSPLYANIKSKLMTEVCSIIAAKQTILMQQFNHYDAYQRDSTSIQIFSLEIMANEYKNETDSLETFLEENLPRQEDITEKNKEGIKILLLFSNVEAISQKIKEVKLNFASSNLHNIVGLETLYEILEKKGYEVTEVDVSGNHLTSLSFNLANMPTVKSIKANNNNISTTNLTQFKPHQGITIDLSGNPLSSTECQKVSQQLLPTNNTSIATKLLTNTLATCCLTSAFIGGLIGVPFAQLKMPIFATPFRKWFNGFMNIGDAIGTAPYTYAHEQKNTAILGIPQSVDAFYYQWRQNFAWLESYLK